MEVLLPGLSANGQAKQNAAMLVVVKCAQSKRHEHEPAETELRDDKQTNRTRTPKRTNEVEAEQRRQLDVDDVLLS